MVTEGYDDPEGELLRRIREVAPDLPIAVAFEFHTNMSKATADNATVITGYRTYPHIDTYETGERAGRTLIRTLSGEIDPIILWHPLPLMTHLNCQTPSRQPMKDIMDKAIAAEADGRVLNASILGGWPLADIPHVGVHGVIVANRPQANEAQALLMEVMPALLLLDILPQTYPYFAVMWLVLVVQVMRERQLLLTVMDLQ